MFGGQALEFPVLRKLPGTPDHEFVMIDTDLDRASPKPRDSLLHLTFAVKEEGHKSLKRLPCPKFGGYDFVITPILISNHVHFHLPTRSSFSTSLRRWSRGLPRTARLVSTHQRDPVHLGLGIGFHQPCAD